MATDPSLTRFTSLGGPTLLIEAGGRRFLTDPTFDPAGSVYPLGPVTLHKQDPPVLSRAQLGRVDAVLLSHEQHPDNLDAAGREVARAAGVVLTTPDSAARFGAPARGLAPWQTHDLTGGEFPVRITAVPARHGPEGTEEATGAVTGFVLEWPGQVHGALYLSGDTVRFPGTAEIAARFRVGTAVLHLGQVRLPAFGAAELSLSAAEAVRLATELNAPTVIPTHYAGWAHFTQGRAEATRIFAASAPGFQVRWLEPAVPTPIQI